MELALEPASNIVCFRYVPQRGDPDQLNKRIMDTLLEDGGFYVVGTAINGMFYLRTTLMNPLTDETCLTALTRQNRRNRERSGGI